MSNQPKIAIIGGTGLETLDGLDIVKQHTLTTQYGAPSSNIVEGCYQGRAVYFLSRHGEDHSIAPHLINYRANIQALKELGISEIVAIAAVGGITQSNPPTSIAVPDQIIDYTYGREHTFVDAGTPVNHIDFSYPYTESLRLSLLKSASSLSLDVVDGGTYGATQGPRLETAAEIQRMKKDGCDLVGMTGMPEAALAREAGINYAALTVVANWGAGIIDTEISLDEIYQNLEVGMLNTTKIIAEVLK